MYIIFVCHGSICRSPAAENIFNNIIKEMGLDNNKIYAKSFALSYEEIGNDIYPPMKDALNRNNIDFIKHEARHLEIEDIKNSDYIFYMDYSNKRIIETYFNDYLNKFHLITKFNNDINEIEDPWYTGRYDLVISELEECINQIIKNIIIK